MFISNDPLQRRTGEMVGLNELNGYRYVKGNPMKYVDVLGLVTKIFIRRDYDGLTIRGDHGHVGIKIDDKFYHFIPTKGIWGTDKGAALIQETEEFVHRHSTGFFSTIENGINLDFFTLNTTKEQEKKIDAYFREKQKDPGNFSIFYNNCLTTTKEALIEAGVFDSSDFTYGADSPQLFLEDLERMEKENDSRIKNSFWARIYKNVLHVFRDETGYERYDYSEKEKEEDKKEKSE